MNAESPQAGRRCTEVDGCDLCERLTRRPNSPQECCRDPGIDRNVQPGGV
ncbi:MAG: hypothetical protein QOI69_2882 [Pseudonocardiales bacterium]|jgi:hypothetical protein|nr:hypothetical protein [Pseudonocardiales bacterium]